MCVQSVSLWAEATWYRLGGGRPSTEDATPTPPASAREPRPEPAPVRQPEQAAEKVLVGR